MNENTTITPTRFHLGDDSLGWVSRFFLWVDHEVTVFRNGVHAAPSPMLPSFFPPHVRHVFMWLWQNRLSCRGLSWAVMLLMNFSSRLPLSVLLQLSGGCKGLMNSVTELVTPRKSDLKGWLVSVTIYAVEDINNTLTYSLSQPWVLYVPVLQPNACKLGINNNNP